MHRTVDVASVLNDASGYAEHPGRGLPGRALLSIMALRNQSCRWFASALALLLVACEGEAPKQSTVASVEVSARLPAPASATAAASAVAPPLSSANASAKAQAFGELVRTLSEPGGDFISDNLISNETSYLQVASALEARSGGAYLGVGPEQNFTYIALTKPQMAFILDIRRDNLLQHLYYRFLFEQAESRSHFLALLVGRTYDKASAPGADATIDAVIAHAEKNPPDPKFFATNLDLAMQRIRDAYGFALDDKDKRSLAKMAQVFYDKQLDLRFELKESSGRKYPMLKELLASADPSGKKKGFLASEEAFRFVQRMERDGRVVPLVGDFAGDGALPALAKYLQKEGLQVSTFYVSNVEQYLLEPPVWARWIRNVAALPAMSDAVILRCYLDQGKKHPKQMEGHRTATVLAKMADFVTREQKSPSHSFYKIATEGVLD